MSSEIKRAANLYLWDKNGLGLVYKSWYLRSNIISKYQNLVWNIFELQCLTVLQEDFYLYLNSLAVTLYSGAAKEFYTNQVCRI